MADPWTGLDLSHLSEEERTIIEAVLKGCRSDQGLVYYDKNDLSVLKDTIYAEAKDEPREAQIALAWVIQNRAYADRAYWGGSRAADICRHRGQFECWNRRDLIDIDDPEEYAKIDEWLMEVLNRDIPDPTNGCDHCNKSDQPSASWVKKVDRVAVIGNLRFYRSLD